MFCGNCGNQLDDRAVMCPKCGVPVSTYNVGGAGAQSFAGSGSDLVCKVKPVGVVDFLIHFFLTPLVAGIIGLMLYGLFFLLFWLLNYVGFDTAAAFAILIGRVIVGIYAVLYEINWIITLINLICMLGRTPEIYIRGDKIDFSYYGFGKKELNIRSIEFTRVDEFKSTYIIKSNEVRNVKKLLVIKVLDFIQLRSFDAAVHARMGR